ncbi:MAG: hypothetical protein WBR26_19440 [Candidatus Acidiferrum sp.]
MISSVKKLGATFLFALLSFATSALAGPPLVCHIFDIGSTKSLPWISHEWNVTGSESYDIDNLVRDTISILDGDPTVLVHMETLRRATLYAQKDPNTAKRLLLSLVARSNAAADTAGSAIAKFDVGYLAETLKQYSRITKTSGNPAQNFDGYALIREAIQLRGNDAQMEFAAALITLDGPASEQIEHAEKAIAGAKSDPLLARNLSAHFRGPQTELMAELISRNSNVKVARQ